MAEVTLPGGMVYGPEGRVEGVLDHSITRHFYSTLTDQGGKVAAEYVWIGGTGQDIRSKTKTLTKEPKGLEDLPQWNYDGSSTGQAPGHDSEVYLMPRAIFKDPFRGPPNILVLCDTFEPPRVTEDKKVLEPKPIPTNTRFACAEAMKKATKEEPW